MVLVFVPHALVADSAAGAICNRALSCSRRLSLAPSPQPAEIDACVWPGVLQCRCSLGERWLRKGRWLRARQRLLQLAHDRPSHSLGCARSTPELSFAFTDVAGRSRCTTAASVRALLSGELVDPLRIRLRQPHPYQGALVRRRGDGQGTVL